MKKILILAYDFPPVNSIGAQRPQSWFKYFSKFGLYPIVITQNSESNVREVKKSENGDIYYVPLKISLRDKIILKHGINKYVFFRKFLSLWSSIFQFVYSKSDSKFELHRAADEVIKAEKIDYILATGEPFILFKYASSLSKKHSINWYADYRDDWINNHSRNHKGFLDKMLRRYEAIFERKYMSNVTGVTTVSNYILEDIKKRISSEKALVIENGVDLSYIKDAEIILDQDYFNIVYTGIFYECGYMDIFIDALKEFLDETNRGKVKIYFVGTETQPCTPYFKVLELKKEMPELVHIVDRVAPQVAVNYQYSASLLLNFIAGDPGKGLIGAKSYSYAATKNPILTIPEIPNKNSSFFPSRDIQFTAINSQEVVSFLKINFNLFEKGATLKTSITDEEIYSISREFGCEKLATFIKD